MRLQKYLALAGVASRRRAEALIRAGRVRVNDRVITTMGVQVEPGQDRVTVDGRPVGLPEKKYYLLLFKPAGYVTTVSDPQGRPKVTDLVGAEVPVRLYPVGRLDYATEGLLLLTNDGELTMRLTHPRYGVHKTYLALVQGQPDANTITHLRCGVNLEDGPTAPARVTLRRAGKNEALLEIILREGRNREVRRMLVAVGHPVLHLRRIRLAFLTLAGLKPGTYRHLTPAEVEGLYRLVGLE